MISRITIFSLLLGLLLGLGIYAYSMGEQDRCATYPAGGVAPRSEYVVTGARETEVPCSNWWMRQSLTVQVLCLLDAVLGTLFSLNAVNDLTRWIAWRRGNKKRAAVE